MFSLFGLITLLHLSHSEENTYYNNGWIPISNEKALSNTGRDFIKTPEKVQSNVIWNPIYLPADNIRYFKENYVIVKPNDLNDELMKGSNYNQLESPDRINRRLLIKDEQKEKDEERDKNEYLSTLHDRTVVNLTPVAQRKPKKILDNSFVTNKLDNDEFMENVPDIIKTTTDNKNYVSNTYEVTEASEASEVKDLRQENQNGENYRPYFIPKPTLNTTKEENLATKLFTVLGNYNIRTNDELTNYAISRKRYRPNHPSENYGYPVALKYNSQNYFPLNPLLAVLLSNYGYYLPGLYGFPGNYNNIYGYLASNNIHNNKPFGAYKVYSDTDSSH